MNTFRLNGGYYNGKIVSVDGYPRFIRIPVLPEVKPVSNYTDSQDMEFSTIEYIRRISDEGNVYYEIK